MKIAGLKAGHKVILDWGDIYNYEEDEEDEATRRLGELAQFTEEERAGMDHPFPSLTIRRVMPKPRKPKRPADDKLPPNIVPLRPETSLSDTSAQTNPAASRIPPVGSPRSARPPGRPSKNPEIEQARVEAWQAGPEAWTAWKISRHEQKQERRDWIVAIEHEYDDIDSDDILLLSGQLWLQDTSDDTNEDLEN
jgi:hypothetical protein